MVKIKVLIVDDSAVVRKILSTELAKDPEIEVVGVAQDPYVARRKIIALKPDVITLDIEMPRMDGITFLDKLKTYYPMPVVVLSALTPAGGALAMKALEMGAIEVMHKPGGDTMTTLPEVMVMLIYKIKAAAQVGVSGYKGLEFIRENIDLDIISDKTNVMDGSKIIAIGASTGGTEALRYIMSRLPENFPPMLITQHMPEYFTKAFAEHLSQISRVKVREASDGDEVTSGLALVAKGNYHMLLRKRGDRYFVEIKDGPLVCRQKPSVDILFDSVAKNAESNSIGVILTGMGSDGAVGLLHMKEAGAYTIAQDEATSVVFGMPGQAIKLNAAHRILPLNQIPQTLINMVSVKQPE